MDNTTAAQEKKVIMAADIASVRGKSPLLQQRSSSPPAEWSLLQQEQQQQEQGSLRSPVEERLSQEQQRIEGVGMKKERGGPMEKTQQQEQEPQEREQRRLKENNADHQNGLAKEKEQVQGNSVVVGKDDVLARESGVSEKGRQEGNKTPQGQRRTSDMNADNKEVEVGREIWKRIGDSENRGRDEKRKITKEPPSSVDVFPIYASAEQDQKQSVVDLLPIKKEVIPAEQQKKKGEREKYYSRKGELYDDDEAEEEDDQQQLQSTVDSVASSTASGNLFARTRVIDAMGRRSTDCDGTALTLNSACAQKVRASSSTPLLISSVLPDNTPPSDAALWDAIAAPPPLQLPSPAGSLRLKRESQSSLAAGDKKEFSLDEKTCEEHRASVRKDIIREARGEENDAVNNTAEVTDPEKKKEITEGKDNKGRTAHPGDVATSTETQTKGSTKVSDAVASNAAAASWSGETKKEETMGEDTKRKSGKKEKIGDRGAKELPKIGRKTSGGITTAVKDEAGAVAAAPRLPPVLLWVQSRRKQTAAEHGRIAAAAVTAATGLFYKKEGSSGHRHQSEDNNMQNDNTLLCQKTEEKHQKQSGASSRIVCGNASGNSRTSSLTGSVATAGDGGGGVGMGLGSTSEEFLCFLVDDLQQQQERQEQGKKDTQGVDVRENWQQHTNEQQEEGKNHIRLTDLKGDQKPLQACKHEAEQQQQQRNEEKEQQEQGHKTEGSSRKQHQNKVSGLKTRQESCYSSAIEFFAAELQKDGRQILRAFCAGEGDEEKEETKTATLEDFSVLPLSSHDEWMYSSSCSTVDQAGRQQLAPVDERLSLSRSIRNEGELRKEQILNRDCVGSSTSLYSLLRQQHKDAPSLLISAAALQQHDIDPKYSSVATISPRRPSSAGGVGAVLTTTAAAISRDVTATTTGARDDVTTITKDGTITTQDLGAMIGSPAGGRADEVFSADYALIRPEPQRDIEQRDGDCAPSSLAASPNEHATLLSLLNTPRGLSLATLTSPSFTAAGAPLHSLEKPHTHLTGPSLYNPSGSSAATTVECPLEVTSKGIASADITMVGGLPGAAIATPDERPSTGLRRKTLLCADQVTDAVYLEDDSRTANATSATGYGEAREDTADAGAASTRTYGEEEGDALTSTPPSLCLQAAVRPPPGFDTKDEEWGPQDREQERVQHCISDVSAGSTTTAATTTTTLSSGLGSASVKKQHASAAAALLANASQESLAAAVAVLAAVAATPRAAAAAGSAAFTEYNGDLMSRISTEAACGREDFYTLAHRLGGALRTSSAGELINSFSSNKDVGASRIAITSPYGSSSLPSEREDRSTPDTCRSGSPLDTASRHLLLAALTREGAAAAAAGGIPTSSGGTVGGGADTRPPLADLAGCVEDTQRQASVLLTGEEDRTASVAASPLFGAYAQKRGGRQIDVVDFSSRERYVRDDGQRDAPARDTIESTANALLQGKHQQQQRMRMQSEHRSSTHQQQQAPKYTLPDEGDRTRNNLRLSDFFAEPQATVERRAVTEGATALTEGARPGNRGSSSFSSCGGRGARTSLSSSGNKRTWPRRGDYGDTHHHLQHGVNGRGGLGERSSRKAAAAAREKVAYEAKKDGFKVFFGNASALTTEEEMYGLFRQFGECSELILLRDRRQRLRGAGFVTFKDAGDAMRAIEGLDRKYTVLGGTKPLEVRIPENSEQKRERIRALARLRAENAQQHAQEQRQQQQQHGNSQKQQDCYDHSRQQQQQLIGSPRQLIAYQRYSPLHQCSSSNGNKSSNMVGCQPLTAFQRQQLAQQQQQAYAALQEQQPHALHGQQLRAGEPQSQRTSHGQMHFYEEQQQRQLRKASLHRARGYVLSSACERVKGGSKQERSWQSADTRLRVGPGSKSLGSSPKSDGKCGVSTVPAVSHHSAAALEALLALAAVRHKRQDHKNRASAEKTTAIESTQELLAWMHEYAWREEGCAPAAALPSQQQQQQRQQQPHLLQQQDVYLTASKHALLPFSTAQGTSAFRNNTLQASGPFGHATPGEAAAAAAAESGVEHGLYREPHIVGSAVSEQYPASLTLTQALATEFPSSPSTAAANDVMPEKIICSTETREKDGVWGPAATQLLNIDRKTTGRYLSDPTLGFACGARDGAPADPSREYMTEVFPPFSSLPAAEEQKRNGAMSPVSCETSGLAYINAVADLLTNRNSNCVSSPCDSVADMRFLHAPATSRYDGSPCASYSHLLPASTGSPALQSVTVGGSPTVPFSFVSSFGATEEPLRGNGDVYDNSNSATAGAALNSLGGVCVFPQQ